ncbi:hypothetical protein [Nostoc sp.]|uniref:hypothetical protein n=1 Tax=Nostoc sp. TaxID=1180 RepID=UPI002FFACF50
METIIHPIKYRIIERKITPEKSYWHFIKGKTFYNPLNLPSEGDTALSSNVKSNNGRINKLLL